MFFRLLLILHFFSIYRDLRPTSLDKGQETYRLVLYELYAWGGPLIIVSVGAIMDQMLMDSYPAILRPNFGGRRCWFGGKDHFQLSHFS